jgi:nucleoside-diphosphate-sugar epimerase
MNIINKVLIVGANGFIGSFLYNRFNKDYSIAGLDYSKGLIEDNFFPLDLTQKADVETFAEESPKCDVLIFLVGLAHKKGKGQELDEFRRINKQTLVNLLSALEGQGKLPKKIIFASTISVYGEKMNQNTYNEESDKNPFSPYAVTKLEAEEFLMEHYLKQSWILRFAPVYSSNFQLNVNRRTKSGRWLYKVGNGRKKLSLCNLENIGFAVQGILEDKVPSGIYNISDENEYTYNDLLTWEKAKWVLPIPVFAIKLLYYVGKFMNSTFLKENTVKLISDNIFPSEKICSHIDLPATINDVKPINI